MRAAPLILLLMLASCRGSEPVPAVSRSGAPVIALSVPMERQEDWTTRELLLWRGRAAVRTARGLYGIDLEKLRATALPDPLKGLELPASAEGLFRPTEMLETPEGVLLVGPGAAWQKLEDGKWDELRFQGAFVPFRPGRRFALGKRLFFGDGLGLVSQGKVMTVDLATTPREWGPVKLPDGFSPTCVAQAAEKALICGARNAGGEWERAVFEWDTRAPRLLFRSKGPPFVDLAAAGSRLLALSSEGILRLDQSGKGLRDEGAWVKFDFPTSLVTALLPIENGVLLATDYGGLYRMAPLAAPVLSRIRLQ